jgi:hypothetical protein
MRPGDCPPGRILGLEAVQGGPLTFQHDVDHACRINDLAHPEAAVAYSLDTIDEVAADAGLQLASLHRGFWCGANLDAPNGQDVAILEKRPDVA